MKLVVGLGNPGRKYQGTRHNIGFDALDELARQLGASARKTKFEAETAEVMIGSERILLLWPQTFMNLSGTSVGMASDFFKVAVEDLLVVCDDFHLPVETLRFRPKGSAGGQKGLADIIRRLGTEAVPRLRIGVGPLPDRWNAADFVLSKFHRSEGTAIEQTVRRAADSVAVWAEQGIEDGMNRFNASPTTEP